MKKNIVLIILLAIGFTSCKKDVITELVPTPSTSQPSQSTSNQLVYTPIVTSDVNTTTDSYTMDKLFIGYYFTLERAFDLKIQINQNSKIDADYRFVDGMRVFLDYNQDGKMDMFAFLCNFKTQPFGSDLGQWALVDDVNSKNPIIHYYPANRRLGTRMRGVDINNDGRFEVLMGSEEDHPLSNGTNGQRQPTEIIFISKTGEISYQEIGEVQSNHGQTYGDVDNDGDIDIINWRNSYTGNLISVPLMYLNNNGVFELQDPYSRFKGLDSLASNKNYACIANTLYDVDKDGKLDLLVAYSHNQDINSSWSYNHVSTRIYWGIGKGYFDFAHNYTDLPIDYVKSVTAQGCLSPLGFNFIDYDNDGDIDIVTTISNNYKGYAIQLCENKGNHKFEDVTTSKIDVFNSTAFPNFYGIRLFDKDGDGDLDLVPDMVSTWGWWQTPISQNLYWENVGGSFKIKN